MFEPLYSSLSPLWALTNSVARVCLGPRGKRLACPVISIGNIVAGGVGKTELAVSIAKHLNAKGRRVVVASRGYGSKWERTGAVAADFETAEALRFPDESLVVLKKAPGVAVAVGADRGAVLLKHWEELHPDVVLLDDGFQHFKLRRELDILVHDFSVKWPVLRELPRQLSRARVRVSLSEVPAQWRDKSGTPWVRARYKLTGAVDAQARKLPLPREALAFCGIGNPGRFHSALVSAGVAVKGFRAFSDHEAYTERDMKSLVEWVRRQERPIPLLTSLKDYVKLAPYVESQGGLAGFEPQWVAIDLEFLENEHVIWNAVDEVIAKGVRV